MERFFLGPKETNSKKTKQPLSLIFNPCYQVRFHKNLMNSFRESVKKPQNDPFTVYWPQYEFSLNIQTSHFYPLINACYHRITEKSNEQISRKAQN